MRETIKTIGFAVAAVILAVSAAVLEPERRTPEILSDQGELFYPKFTDPSAARSIEVIDYDEPTATARPFKVEFQKGRWVLPSHSDYPLDSADRLIKTAAALIDLRKDLVRTESVQDHGACGVIDPLDQKASGLTGRGKRVTLRDAHKQVLADYILGKAVESRAGYRYVRVPGQKRVYAVKTDADPSARFGDWVRSQLLGIQPGTIRRASILSYRVDERAGRLENVEQIALTLENGQWKMAGAEVINTAAVTGMVSTLDNLRIVDARPKPPSLAQDLKTGKLQLSIDIAMSLRQRGFFITPNGRLLANEGELSVETANGLAYGLRFGEVATGGNEVRAGAAAGEDRFLFVTVSYDVARAAKYGDTSGTGERRARELTNRFADWYYVISGPDFQKLRLKRKDLVK